MAFDVTSFKLGNPFGGARPSNFMVSIEPPPTLGLPLQGKFAFGFRVRTSQLPGRTISTSEVPYMGRTIKVNGAPTFEDWETTVYEDEDFSVHEMITVWMDRINGSTTNKMSPTAALNSYMGSMKVTVSSKTGLPIRQVLIENAWPTVLGPAELVWANNDEFLNFPVTWALSNWTWDGNPLSIGKSALDSAVAAPALALASGMSWASGE